MATNRLSSIVVILLLVWGSVLAQDPATVERDFERATQLHQSGDLQGAVRGMTNALDELLKHGILQEDSNIVATFAERQALVQKTAFDDFERRYSGDME